MTRIYYKKLPKTFKLVTKDKFLGHYDMYVGFISLVDYTYEIRSLSNKIVCKSKANSLHEAKKDIKKELKLLGVNFYDEIRKESI
jgi:hypothetical protein